MAGTVPKMAVFLCPSGCDEILRINLMPEMGPAWRARLDSRDRLSLSPSVALASGCKAHFILSASQARVVSRRRRRR